MITNDEAVNSVYKTIEYIEQLPISEGNLSDVQRLKDLIRWIEVQVDENKKMAEYLLYLNECNKIPLVRDGFGWLLIKEEV